MHTAHVLTANILAAHAGAQSSGAAVKLDRVPMHAARR